MTLQNKRSNASISILFAEVLVAKPRRSCAAKAPPRHTPSANKPASQIRSPKPTTNIRQVDVSDRHLLPIPSDTELIARYHAWLTTVCRTFQSTYKASHEDFEDAMQDGLMKLIKISPQYRNHDVYCKRCLVNQLNTSFARHRRVNDPLMPIDPDWDQADQDEKTPGILSHLPAPQDSSLQDLISSEFVQEALRCLSVEHALVISLYLGLGENSKPIQNLRTLSKRSFVAEAKLLPIIRSATARLKRWHRPVNLKS